MNIFADEQDDDALLDSRCNSTTIVFGRRKWYPKSQQLLFICTWETCSYLPHAGLYSTSQPNNDIMPTTVWSAACSDETSMPWPNIFLPSTQTCLFSSAHPTPHKKDRKHRKRKKKVEEVTSVLCVTQFGQQRAIFHKALLFQSKVELMHNINLS